MMAGNPAQMASASVSPLNPSEGFSEEEDPLISLSCCELSEGSLTSHYLAPSSFHHCIPASFSLCHNEENPSTHIIFQNADHILLKATHEKYGTCILKMNRHSNLRGVEERLDTSTTSTAKSPCLGRAQQGSVVRRGDPISSLHADTLRSFASVQENQIQHGALPSASASANARTTPCGSDTRKNFSTELEEPFSLQQQHSSRGHYYRYPQPSQKHCHLYPSILSSSGTTAAGAPNGNKLARPRSSDSLRREYEIYHILRQHLSTDKLCQVHEYWRGEYDILVLEEFEATDLLSYICDKGPLTTSKFLAVATKIAEVLSQIHSRRVLHLDLKPSNILFSPDDNTVKIIDFDSAQFIPAQGCIRNKTDSRTKKALKDSHLFYKSPEQTGEITESLSRRSDIFSLGRTFYTLLTGETLLPSFEDTPSPQSNFSPFTSAQSNTSGGSLTEGAFSLPSSPHTQRSGVSVPCSPRPISQISPEVPHEIIALVEKMMERDPAQRYQSTQSVYVDLVRLSESYEKHRIFPVNFVPSAVNLPDDAFFVSSGALYGRSEEVNRLSELLRDSMSEAQHKVSTAGIPAKHTSSKQFCVLHGESGSGRTSLVEHTLLEQESSLGSSIHLVTAKCDRRMDRRLPFHPFSQIMRQLIIFILNKHPLILRRTKEQLRRSMSETQVQCLVACVREARQLFDWTSSPRSRSNNDAQSDHHDYSFDTEAPSPHAQFLVEESFSQVYQDAFHSFLLSLIRHCQGDVTFLIFIDNLQWMDQASLGLMERLLTSEELHDTHSSPSVHLLGGQDNTILKDTKHIVNQCLSRLQKDHDVEVEFMAVPPLSEENIHKIVSDSTLQPLEESMPLSQHISKISAGNSLFIREYLVNLYHNEMLSFNSESHSWCCDLSSEEMQEHSFESVEECIRSNIELLAGEYSKRVLFFASCIGAEFSVRTLSILFHQWRMESTSSHSDNTQYSADREEPLTIQYLSDALLNGWITDSNGDYYHFSHDKVREACLQLYPEKECLDTHRKLAFLLYNNSFAPMDLHSRMGLFVAVTHLYKCLSLFDFSHEEHIDECVEFFRAAASLALNCSFFDDALDYIETARKLFQKKKIVDHSVKMHLTQSYIRAVWGSGNEEKCLEVALECMQQAVSAEERRQVRSCVLKCFKSRSTEFSKRNSTERKVRSLVNVQESEEQNARHSQELKQMRRSSSIQHSSPSALHLSTKDEASPISPFKSTTNGVLLSSDEREELTRLRTLYHDTSNTAVPQFVIRWNAREKRYERVQVESSKSCSKRQ